MILTETTMYLVACRKSENDEWLVESFALKATIKEIKQFQTPAWKIEKAD